MASPDRVPTPGPATDDVVPRILEHYGIVQAQATLLRRGDNTVYRVEVPGGSWALRLHTAARLSARALSSELAWLDVLARGGLPVPQPARSASGAWVVGLAATRGLSPLLCTLLTWVEGEGLPEGRGFDLVQASQAGELLARLHLQAEQFSPPEGFERPHYGAPHFIACWADLEQSLSPHLPAERLTRFRRALEGVVAVLERPGRVPGGAGLIHADPHPGNFLRRPAGLALLDFDRCGWGPFLLDVAGATLDLEPPKREALTAGYTRIRPLPAEYGRPLKALKVLAAVENLAFLARRPHELPFVLEALPVVEDVLSQVQL